MLKKFISTLVLICVMTCCFSFNVFAETTVDDEIALMNLYTNKISTNITVNSTGNTESKKPKPNIKRPLFLSFAYIVSDAGMARKFPFKNKKLVQIPL